MNRAERSWTVKSESRIVQVIAAPNSGGGGTHAPPHASDPLQGSP